MVSTAAPPDLDRAYAYCERLARTHYENFPVASWLVPRDLRRHVAAIYAFARTADDFADEPGRTAAQRLQLLDEWSHLLHSTSGSADREPTLIFAAVADTRRRFGLPIELFEDLLSAFRQDVIVSRYRSWDELFDYCRRSANPVGRLVLRLFGHNDECLDRYSDAVCTALQLTNFWQDLAIDWQRGRLYVPEEECQSLAVNPDVLESGKLTRNWRLVLLRCGMRTRGLFHGGRPICDAVGGRLRYELRATWLGGMRILDRLHRVDFDVFNHRPSLGIRDVMVIGWKAATWRATRPFTTPS